MQNIPSVFREKTIVDELVTILKNEKVIQIDEAFKAIRLQRSLRRMCQVALAMAKVDPDGAGSPVAMVA